MMIRLRNWMRLVDSERGDDEKVNRTVVLGKTESWLSDCLLSIEFKTEDHPRE